MSFPDLKAVEPSKPRELLGLADDGRLVHFVDAIGKPPEEAGAAVLGELGRLRYGDEVLLVRNSRDPHLTRFEFGRRGYASWAEERRADEWYVYFYRPHASAGAVAFRPVKARAAVAAKRQGKGERVRGKGSQVPSPFPLPFPPYLKFLMRRCRDGHGGRAGGLGRDAAP